MHAQVTRMSHLNLVYNKFISSQIKKDNPLNLFHRNKKKFSSGTHG